MEKLKQIGEKFVSKGIVYVTKDRVSGCDGCAWIGGGCTSARKDYGTCVDGEDGRIFTECTAVGSLLYKLLDIHRFDTKKVVVSFAAGVVLGVLTSLLF